MSHYNYSICTSCKGACCKAVPGIYLPTEIGELSVDSITELLHKGKHSIDWWDGDIMGGKLDRTLYIRPRTVKGGKIDPSWGGQCINLTETGCSLSESERPFQCRMLIPSEGFECNYDKKDKADKKSVIKEWYPYQELLNAVINNL